MREVSWGTVPRVPAAGGFCKLRAPPIKLSLHFWTLSNPLVSRIIPLSETCNNSLYKLNFHSHNKRQEDDNNGGRRSEYLAVNLFNWKVWRDGRHGGIDQIDNKSDK